jgi:hypothetical protein
MGVKALIPVFSLNGSSGWGGPPLCIDLTWEDPRLWGIEEFSTFFEVGGEPLGWSIDE